MNGPQLPSRKKTRAVPVSFQRFAGLWAELVLYPIEGKLRCIIMLARSNLCRHPRVTYTHPPTHAHSVLTATPHSMSCSVTPPPLPPPPTPLTHQPSTPTLPPMLVLLPGSQGVVLLPWWLPPRWLPHKPNPHQTHCTPRGVWH
jgi:hypothetical protein